MTTDAMTAALDRLRALRRRRRRLDTEEHDLITRARDAGASWQDIATALGIQSRQGAEQRYQRYRRRLHTNTNDGGRAA